ncbi:MAG TPA: SCO family protein [Acetobacteraceae bacterium]|nr:SCO family protein [Acetobacteraceae bacterium]
MTAWLLLLAALTLWSQSVLAAVDPAQFTYRQQIGSRLSLDLPLHDETGRDTTFRQLFGVRPVILALGYFHCPNLCGVVRADVTDAVLHSDLQSDDYTLVVLSIDTTETAEDASRAEQQDLQRAGAATLHAPWHYLTGDDASIRQVEQDVGFNARFDAAARQFLHPAGLVFLTPDGTISSYLLGVGYQPGDVQAGVRRAQIGAVAQAASPVLLICFHYDPHTGRYTLSILKLLELACALTVATVGGLIALATYRERQS